MTLRLCTLALAFASIFGVVGSDLFAQNASNDLNRDMGTLAQASGSATLMYGQSAYESETPATTRLGNTGYSAWIAGGGQTWYLNLVVVCVARTLGECSNTANTIRLVTWRSFSGRSLIALSPTSGGSPLYIPFNAYSETGGPLGYGYQIERDERSLSGSAIWLDSATTATALIVTDGGVNIEVRLTAWAEIPCPPRPGQSCGDDSVIGDVSFEFQW